MEKILYGFHAEAFEKELEELLTWWSGHMPDPENGGFWGKIRGNNQVEKYADKGIILNARILWFFSAACNLGYSQYRPWADKAFEYLMAHFADKEFGGVYWMVDCHGGLLNGKKQSYAQAFALYAATEYYQLCGMESSLALAMQLFYKLEDEAKDPFQGGYIEALDQQWQAMKNVALSEKEEDDVKTMNTHLHILEAYTNLARAFHNEKVMSALDELIRLYIKWFIDGETGRLKLFFDLDWNERVSHTSYGHEIETAWLLNEACKVCGNPELTAQAKDLGLKIAKRVLTGGRDEKAAIYNEKYSDGHFHHQRDWWPQAEGVVGFFDAYQQNYNEAFLLAAEDLWTYIQLYFKDFQNGEWYWAVNEDGTPDTSQDKAGPWKAPYHNGRMCIEMIRRLSNV
ncbi:MAG: AGE family epimerase/isomerase [Saprospiraceae bacterium]|nr:AGE family epimerase/isomerase [Saprospiraceae bacterium]